MKPQTSILIGVAAYFLTLTLNRFLAERNYRSLSREDKMKLLDEFSTHRSMATYIPIAVMACTIAVIYFHPALFRWVFPFAIVLVMIVSIVLQLSVFRHLRSLGLPDDYVSKFRFQSVAIQAGNVVALVMFAYGIVGITE